MYLFACLLFYKVSHDIIASATPEQDLKALINAVIDELAKPTKNRICDGIIADFKYRNKKEKEAASNEAAAIIKASKKALVTEVDPAKRFEHYELILEASEKLVEASKIQVCGY